MVLKGQVGTMRNDFIVYFSGKCEECWIICHGTKLCAMLLHSNLKQWRCGINCMRVKPLDRVCVMWIPKTEVKALVKAEKIHLGVKSSGVMCGCVRQAFSKDRCLCSSQFMVRQVNYGHLNSLFVIDVRPHPPCASASDAFWWGERRPLAFGKKTDQLNHIRAIRKSIIVTALWIKGDVWNSVFTAPPLFIPAANTAKLVILSITPKFMQFECFDRVL